MDTAPDRCWRITGRVAGGEGRGASFTTLPWVRQALRQAFGMDPWPGTLNLDLLRTADLWAWGRLRCEPFVPLREHAEPTSCAARCWPVVVAGRVPAVVVLPGVPGYRPDRIELVSPLNLREALGLADASAVQLEHMAPRSLSALLFDADGTLVDSLDAYRAVAERVAAPRGYRVSLEQVKAALNTDRSFWDLVLDGHPDHSEERVRSLREETLRHWPDVLEAGVEPVPQLADVLAALDARGIRLGIVTGSGGETLSALERAGLLRYFAAVVTAGDVRRRKPHPEGLLHCARRLGVAPGEAAYVGDTPLDMRAARQAGMLAVGVLGGAGDSAQLAAAGAQRLLPDLSGLPALLATPAAEAAG